MKKGYITPMKQEAVATKKDPADAILAIYGPTPAPDTYILPVDFKGSYHQPHLENFFNSIRGKAKLTCPAEIGYETAVTVLKVNDALEAGRRMDFAEADFRA